MPGLSSNDSEFNLTNSQSQDKVTERLSGHTRSICIHQLRLQGISGG